MNWAGSSLPLGNGQVAAHAELAARVLVEDLDLEARVGRQRDARPRRRCVGVMRLAGSLDSAACPVDGVADGLAAAIALRSRRRRRR